MQQIQNGSYNQAGEQSEMHIWMGMRILSIQNP